MSAPASKAPPAQRRDTTINLRLPGKVRELIDTAAAASGTTRTEFVIESARRRAIDVMLDQRLLVLEADDWKALNRILDNPPPPNDRLRNLMARKPPWHERREALTPGRLRLPRAMTHPAFLAEMTGSTIGFE